MPTDVEQIDQLGHHLLKMFVAVCAAPDDPTVAVEANMTLHELDRAAGAVQ